MILPRISLVMPCLNQVRFIQEAIESVISQEYPLLEFMILDGGSTDGTIEIIKKYEKHITYWHSQPDKGQTDALIKGFNMTGGDLFAWVNSDDVLLEKCLHRIAAAYQENPEGGIFAGDYLLIDEKGRIQKYKKHTRRAAWFGQRGVQIVSPEWFFSRQAYQQVGGLNPELDYVMDTDLFFRMILAGIEFVYIDKALVGFRQHPDAKTVSRIDLVYSESPHLRTLFEAKYRNRTILSRIRFLYRAHQILNGNFLRSQLLTRRFQGKSWKGYR